MQMSNVLLFCLCLRPHTTVPGLLSFICWNHCLYLCTPEWSKE